MYIPDHYRVNDVDELGSFITANAFGQLVSQVDRRPFSSHLPFILSDDGLSLFAHIARANPQYKTIEGQEVLVSLAGPHDYVSPAWYASKGVPTWNYQAVHIYGRCITFNEPEKLKKLVDQLTHKYEAAYDEPWQPNYAANMLRGIIGLEISINEIQGKYKLSQNRSDEDRERVIQHLDDTGSAGLAAAMRSNLNSGSKTQSG